MLKFVRPVLLGVALCAGTGAYATTITPSIDGQWNTFDVDDISALSGGLEWIDVLDGSALSFAFTSSSFTLVTVVDAAFSGDRFVISDNAVDLGETSAASNSYPVSIGLDFDAALASGAYSSRSFLLAAGSHLITGRLSQSALDDLGNPINATVGAVRFSSVAAPETGMAMAGIVSLLLVRRRRQMGH